VEQNVGIKGIIYNTYLEMNRQTNASTYYRKVSRISFSVMGKWKLRKREIVPFLKWSYSYILFVALHNEWQWDISSFSLASVSTPPPLHLIFFPHSPNQINEFMNTGLEFSQK
jgi:hypothetical protein